MNYAKSLLGDYLSNLGKYLNSESDEIVPNYVMKQLESKFRPNTVKSIESTIKRINKNVFDTE